jgi:hypothetical protein
MLAALTILLSIFALTALATTTKNDVAGAAQDSFETYLKPQIIKAVNEILLPIVDGILAILFIIKIATAGMNYRNGLGEGFGWHVPAILFIGLVVSLTAPLWLWVIIGWDTSIQAA